MRQLVAALSGKRARKSNGQTLAEFALILPLFLLLVLVALDFGRALYGWVVLQNAARIGANFAGVYPYGWSGPDATIQAEYEVVIERDLVNANCTPPSTPPAPVFTDGPDTFLLGGNPDTAYDVGDSVRVDLSCDFRPLTPIVSAVMGSVVQLRAGADFRIRAGEITGLAHATQMPPPGSPGPTPTPGPIAHAGHLRQPGRELQRDTDERFRRLADGHLHRHVDHHRGLHDHLVELGVRGRPDIEPAQPDPPVYEDRQRQPAAVHRAAHGSAGGWPDGQRDQVQLHHGVPMTPSSVSRIMPAGRRAQRGQTLVETALVLPVLLLLIFALVDFGRGVYAWTAISNAARDGARLAIVDQTVTGGVSEAAREAAEQATGLAIDPTDPNQVAVAYRSEDLAATCPTRAIGCVVEVRVQYLFTPITPVIGQIVGSIPLAATTRIPIERTNP